IDLSVTCHQSNHEGAVVDLIQACRGRDAGLVINPAAYTHTSVALRDAILAIRDEVVVVEVHMTVPSGREWFRQQNMLADIVHGRIEGFGADSYILALRAASALIASRGDRDQ
ncbi:MAG: type II 3-dehydroquinate dehydratase, partial [Myxococcota bacterium]